MKQAKLIAAVALFALAGCFKPPEIVMVDRATALEQQAAGSFDDLERQLDRAGIEPIPVPLTPQQLEALGIRPAPLVDQSELTDADRLDGLLAQHCVGEGKDGLVVETHDACKGGADADEVQSLVERANRARLQLWRWMHEQRGDVSVEQLQRQWRENHLRNVVCEGWIQDSAGKWQAKSC
jgi:nucleotide-binding universal stress UspA family protein